jgi:hypothetical protein
MFDQNDVDTYQFVLSTDLVRRETSWCTIYLNTTSGNVHVVQRWLYQFTVAPGLPPWTDDEKTNFHYALTSAVGGTWDSQTPVGNSPDPIVQQIINLLRKPSNVRIGVSGTGAVAQRFSSTGLDVDFDIVLTSTSPQWRVTLQKLTQWAHSQVDWTARTIQLNSLGNNPRGACQAGPGAACVPTGFVTNRHEFGHTLQNDDEYTVSSPSRSDLGSIMNIGTGVRPRHLSFVTTQLNSMVPGCVFRAV